MDLVKNIKSKIFTLRGVQVMLDRDLADFYEVKAIRLREQVKRNIEKFPEDFMFQLTEKEVDIMVSQNAIPSKKHLGGSLPFAFTEHGVANISSVLTNKKAIHINIQIIRIFVEMKKFISKNAEIFYRLNNVEKKQLEFENNFEKIFSALETEKPKQGIFYDGQIFDAYNFISKLIKQAKKEIILFDNYVDETVLILLSKKNNKVSVKIYTKTITKQLKLDAEKFNQQYPKLELINFTKSHDRFIIIDDEIYHFGASLKDLGKKWFAFSKLSKETIIEINKFKKD
jgi:hypothetical protein